MQAPSEAEIPAIVIKNAKKENEDGIEIAIGLLSEETTMSESDRKKKVKALREARSILGSGDNRTEVERKNEIRVLKVAASAVEEAIDIAVKLRLEKKELILRNLLMGLREAEDNRLKQRMHA